MQFDFLILALLSLNLVSVFSEGGEHSRFCRGQHAIMMPGRHYRAHVYTRVRNDQDAFSSSIRIEPFRVGKRAIAHSSFFFFLSLKEVSRLFARSLDFVCFCT
jgi:hypothetical protein